MQFLIDFAAEDEEFNQILRRAAEYDTVQGVVLDVDRLWLRMWLLIHRWGEARFNRWFDAWQAGLASPETAPPDGPNIFHTPLTRGEVEGWRPERWGRLQERRGLPEDGLPLVVKVCLRPQAGREERFPLVENLRPEGGRLQLEIEARPPARLASDPRKAHAPVAGGVSIGVGATDFGTLGVILTDSAGTQYALTCSHVAGAGAQVKQPSQVDSSSPALIGKSIAATTLAVCPAGMKCNPWSGVSPNALDLSLIEIDRGRASAILEVLDIGPLTGIMPRASLSTTQAVEAMGRTSRHNALQVGGVAVWYLLSHNGADYCFHNLFEVESPYGRAGLVRDGDSGAPVCAADASGVAWAGLIVGCDAFKGFAMYSEAIDGWLQGQGYALQVK